MSKELSLLETFGRLKFNYFQTNKYANEDDKRWFDIIEKALKRLEKYDLDLDFANDCQIYGLKPFEETIKKLKALEIIKEHGADVAEIMICQDYVQYEARFCGNVKGRVKLNEEEFDLLKEVLL